MRDLKGQVVKAFKWDFGGNLLLKFGSFFVSIILARLLTPEEFGIMAIVMILVGISQALVNLGFSSAIINQTEVNQTQLSTVFFINLILSLFLFLVFILVSGPLSIFYKTPLLKPMIQVTALIFILNGLGQVQRSIFVKSLSYSTLTIVQVVALLASGIIAIYASLKGLGVWALVIQQLVLSTTSTSLLWVFSKWRPTLQFDLNSIEGLFRYGINLFGVAVMESLFIRLDGLLIGKAVSAGTLGLYTRSLSMQSFVNSVSTNGLNVLFPALSHLKGDRENFNRYFLKVFEIIAYTSVFLSAILWLIAKPLFLVLLGEEWVTSSVYFQILMITGFAYPLSLVIVHSIKATGRSEVFLKIDILKKLLFLPTFILIFYSTVTTFLWCRNLAVFAGLLINVYTVCTLLGLNANQLWKIVLEAICIAILPLVMVFFLPEHGSNVFNLFIKSATFSLIFLGCLILLKQEMSRNLIHLLFKS